MLGQVSGGRLGEALKYVQDPDLMDQRKQKIDDLIHLLRSDRVERLNYAEKAFRRNRTDFSDTLQIWVSFWRDVLVMSVGDDFGIYNHDYKKEVASAAEEFGHQTAREQASNIQKVLYQLDMNVNVWLLGEVLLLDLPEPID